MHFCNANPSVASLSEQPLEARHALWEESDLRRMIIPALRYHAPSVIASKHTIPGS
jgi:hypothetical protein